jgi:hypothetical protein
MLIIQILTRHAKRIHPAYPKSIKSWTPWFVGAFSVPLIVTWVSNRFPSKRKIKPKTSFITPFDAFCYTTMPCGLKSVGAMYQRGIPWCLHIQLRRHAEAYVDDVVVKTQEEEGLISDLAETFDNMRKFKMKLNPKKCTFGVPLGKLLGYMVSHFGIDPNLEKVLAIMKMMPPKRLHDV